MKFRDNGTNASLEWVHDFAPGGVVPQTGNGQNIASRFISDIEIAFIDDRNNGSDVIYTGRFGALGTNGTAPFMEIPFSVNLNPTVFNGNYGGSKTHGQCSMFLGSLDENPEVSIGSESLCLTDAAINIGVEFDPLTSNGATYNVPMMNIVFNGNGITNSTLGTFDPIAAGLGTHLIYIDYHYFGCGYLNELVSNVEVVHDDFPIHPTSPTGSMAEGMGVAAWSHKDDNPLGFDVYYNSGTYTGSIVFEEDGGGQITLNSTTGVPAGYVVAYGPCGALWADNFEVGTGGSKGYVEAMVLDSTNRRLYVVGSVDEDLTLSNSSSLTCPTTSINGSQSLSGITANKGFLAQINALTGKIEWIYLGGNPLTEENEFHGLDKIDGQIAVVGEFEDTYSGQTSSISATATGASPDIDILVLMLDTFGVEQDVSSIGANGDDHGDAISLYTEHVGSSPWKVDAVVIGDISEGGMMNVITSNLSFGTIISNQAGVVPPGNGMDVILAHYQFSSANGILVAFRLRHFDGTGDDFGKDVKILGAGDFSGLAPNEIVYCGQFADQIDTSSGGIGMFLNPAGGTTDIDGFVGTTTINLGQIGWFSNEGSAGSEESFNALAYHNGKVYGTGQFQLTPSTTILGGGSGVSVGISRTGIFTAQFPPDGDPLGIDNDFAEPSNSGTNTGNDIIGIDTSLFSTGSIIFPTLLSNIVFFGSSGPGVLSSPNINNDQTFIARTRAIDNVYFKRGSIRNQEEGLPRDADVTVYPNPNNGSMTIQFNDAVSGKLQIFNNLGEILFSSSIVESASKHISLDLPSGLYHLKFESRNQLITQRFIVAQ